MKPIIRVANLSKQFRIGERQTPYKTLRESLVRAVREPMKTLLRNPGGPEPTIWALKDVSFDVMPGEVVGVIGRNGAGKSTLLKILSRITEPTQGRIDLYGRVGSLLEVGTGFHAELSGRENIYLNGAILGMKRAEIDRKLDEIISFAEVEKFIDTPVKHYSSGMYLRLAFAVAAHLETEILLVDEVLAVGDAEFQKKCLSKMDSVAKDGRTVMFVSHHMAAVQQLCSRVFLVRAGTISLQGEPEAVLSRYLNDAIDSSQGDFDLTCHPARSTKHRPIIRRLRLFSSAGEPTSHFYPDEALIAELSLDPPAPIRGPRVAMAIEDSFGRRIMTLASYFQGSGLSSIVRPTRIRCKLPQLNLGASNYLLSVSVADVYTGLLDSLDNVARFEVGWRNSYGNGEPYERVYGPILRESSWEAAD
jgi:lipopolysaccharide transport system ATP-binding protein